MKYNLTDEIQKSIPSNLLLNNWCYLPEKYKMPPFYITSLKDNL